MSDSERKIRKLSPDEAKKYFPPEKPQLTLVKGSNHSPRSPIRQLFNEPRIPGIDWMVGEEYEPRFVTVTNTHTKSQTLINPVWDEMRFSVGSALAFQTITEFCIINRDLDLLALDVAAARGTSDIGDISQIRSALLEVWLEQTPIQED